MDARAQIDEKGKDVARAVAFLSRIPMPSSLFDDAAHSAAANQAWAYPLAGLIIGLPGALAIVTLDAAGPSLLASLIAIAITTIITGALHEDGLADITDGFWGGWTVERRLEIMKDSSVGAFGVLALIIWFSIAAVALSSTIEIIGSASAALSWLAVCAASRGAMTALWATTAPARTTGVAYSAGQPSDVDAIISAILVAAIALLLIMLGAPIVVLVAVLLAAATVFSFRVLCLNKIGGHTGDTLGAAQKVAELAMLIGLAIML